MNFDFAIALQIFVLLNPLSSFPFLISAHERRMNVISIALKSVATAFIIAAVMVFIGPYLFKVFGITLDAFRIAGGVVLLLLGLDMVKPKENDGHKIKSNVDSLIAIIATPMLTGPGTISYITIKTIEIGMGSVFISLIEAFVLVSIVFFLFSVMVSKINPTLINILSRVLGLFLMAVAAGMMLQGFAGVTQIVSIS